MTLGAAMPRVGQIDLGGVTVELLDGGSFCLDAGTMFGIVPKAAWAKKVSPDSKNRIPLGCSVALVRSGSRIALVEAGLGDKWDDRARDIYAIQGGPAHVALRAHKLSPEQVTDVILTHLHFDHAAGMTRCPDADSAANPVISFPNATVYVQKDEWLAARRPNEISRGSYRPENLDPLAKHDKLVLVEGGKEILPGVAVFATGGHSDGHQIVRIQGRKDVLYVLGDILCTVHHLRLAWLTAYDRDTYCALEAKKRILARAADENAIVWIYHEPLYPAVRIRPVPGQPEYSFEPVIERQAHSA
jgi:glyoxylase-like metal-dependent hydrolase (beta-lactamase superfamily II)